MISNKVPWTCIDSRVAIRGRYLFLKGTIDCIDLPRILKSVEEYDQSTKINLTKSLLKKKSDFCPAPSTNPNAAAFLKLVNMDLQKLKIHTECPTNLNVKEALALKQLSDNKLLLNLQIRVAMLSYQTMNNISICVTKFLKIKIGIAVFRQTLQRNITKNSVL